MTDQGTVRIIAAGLMLLGVVVVAGLLYVVATADLPVEARVAALTTVGAIGTTAVGAGASLLASTRNAGGTAAAVGRLDDVLPAP